MMIVNASSLHDEKKTIKRADHLTVMLLKAHIVTAMESNERQFNKLYLIRNMNLESKFPHELMYACLDAFDLESKALSQYWTHE